MSKNDKEVRILLPDGEEVRIVVRGDTVVFEIPARVLEEYLRERGMIDSAEEPAR